MWQSCHFWLSRWATPGLGFVAHIPDVLTRFVIDYPLGCIGDFILINHRKNQPHAVYTYDNMEDERRTCFFEGISRQKRNTLPSSTPRSTTNAQAGRLSGLCRQTPVNFPGGRPEFNLDLVLTLLAAPDFG